MSLSPLQWLIDFLICLANYAVGILLAGVVALINLLILALMLLLAPILALLPELNLDPSSLPPFLAWANWVFPLDQFVLITGMMLVFLGVWHIAAIALRWLKVIE